MKKSIEDIWKEGFLDNDALIVPKVNDLYNRKSVHVVEQAKRSIRIYMTVWVVVAVFILGLTLIKNFPIVGISFCVVAAVVVVINRRLAEGATKLNNTSSSLDYLNEFNAWMKHYISTNAKMGKYVNSGAFFFLILGIWCSEKGPKFGEKFFSYFDHWYSLNGVPVIALLPILIITFLLWCFGEQIFKLDAWVYFGRVLNKLEEIQSDMKELKSD